jgi:small acid-soluble spore protein H (minor)
MNLKKAIEIVDSLGVINITYKNSPVWIENINRENRTAQVKDLKTDKFMEVSISELVEE